MGNMVQQKIKDYINLWEKRCYSNGIPDQAPVEINDKVPSYKKICLCLLKNDFNLKGLGYEVKKSKYYNILKRIELEKRKKTQPYQLKMF